MIFTYVYSQTPSPIIEDFNSTDQPGEWASATGQPNTGSHVGQLCYNITGNYLDNQYYSYESQSYDLTTWAIVEVTFSLTQNIRNGDQLALYYFDSATLSWWGWDLSGLNGTYMVTAPTTATKFSFDFNTNTNTNGNINGKYVHIDYIYLQDPVITLPIELISFTGTSNEEYNELNWTTASEINSDYYDIQWSADACDWESIWNLSAAGNSTSDIHYSFQHRNYTDGFNYYKLVQYDYDGWFEEFDIIAIDNRQTNQRIIKYVDFSGREINPIQTKGLVIGIYEDGSSIQIYLK